MPLKILLLTWDFPPTRGGIQTWMHRLARDLPDAQVRVLAPSVPGARAFDRAPGNERLDVRRLGAARLGRVPWLSELALRTVATCLTWRPDLVVCGHVVAAPAALLAHRLTRIPYVVFTHAYEIRRRHRRRYYGSLLRQARLVIANSQFTRQAVLGLGVAPERVRILHPGVDADRYAPAADQRLPGTDHRPPTLLTVGRLAEPYKGQDTAIRVLPLVRGKVPLTVQWIVGDGPLRRYLMLLATSLGLDPNVEFMGEASDDDLIHMYGQADLLLLLARDSGADGGAEGFGIVCLEAAACGIPVVAGRSGGLPDAVEDGVTGILVDPHDLGAAAEAVVSLLQDPVRARAMGEAGRRRVLERFTWEKVMGEARRVLGECFERPRQNAE